MLLPIHRRYQGKISKSNKLFSMHMHETHTGNYLCFTNIYPAILSNLCQKLSQRFNDSTLVNMCKFMVSKGSHNYLFHLKCISCQFMKIRLEHLLFQLTLIIILKNNIIMHLKWSYLFRSLLLYLPSHIIKRVVED